MGYVRYFSEEIVWKATVWDACEVEKILTW